MGCALLPVRPQAQTQITAQLAALQHFELLSVLHGFKHSQRERAGAAFTQQYRGLVPQDLVHQSSLEKSAA
jgi:hypothetical protein